MLTEKNTLAPVKMEYSGPMVGTSVIVRRSDGMILMGVRKGAHGAGKYSFPGGKEDHGESPEQAAQRELFEEAGIDAKVSLFLPHPMVSRVFEETGNHWLTIYYIAEVDMDAEPKVMEPKKCAGWEWVDPSNLPQPLFEPIANSPELIEALANLSMGPYVKADKQPAHDGRYLCMVRVAQPCGTVWSVERIVDRAMGKWDVGEGGTVTGWMPLPHGGWPQHTDK